APACGIPAVNPPALHNLQALGLGGELLEFFLVADIVIGRKVDHSRLRLVALGRIRLVLEAAVDQLLGVVRSHFGGVHPGPVALTREVGNRLAVGVGPIYADYPHDVVLAALGIHRIGVVTAGVSAPALDLHHHTVGPRVLLLQLLAYLAAQLLAGRVPGENPAVYQPDLLADPSGIHPALRSEEHTSELQSRENLVCRLLLEKKKETKEITI